MVACELDLSHLEQLIGNLNYRARQTRAKANSIDHWQLAQLAPKMRRY
jgi:hypothetical protein